MKTINLLPKIRQQEIRYEAMLGALWVIVSLSAASFALVFLAQIAVKVYLQIEAGSIKSQTAQLQSEVDKQQNADVKAQVKAVNDLISDYSNLVASSPKWSKVIKAFAPLPPQGVKINSFNIDPVGKSVTINGISPTRDLVIELYNNILNDSNDFYNINYPLENVVLPVNVDFHFTFFIQDKLLQ
jgi:hypothetical protein